MSNGINKVILVGNVGKAPELKSTQQGRQVLSINLATSELSQARDGEERKEFTEWHQISVWGKQAEALATMVQKGTKLYVEGSLRTRSWEKDGVKRYATGIQAFRVLVLSGGMPKGEGGDRADMAPYTPDDDIPF
jgi:single-strand DNA-binding protein